MLNKILSNQVVCDRCGDKPFSASVHDYKPCKCGSISVDGGMSYLRRVGNIDAYKDISIQIPEDAYKAALDAIKWAKDTGRNDLGILCAVAVALRDNGVNLVTKEEDK